jgi:hypothetical protein
VAAPAVGMGSRDHVNRSVNVLVIEDGKNYADSGIHSLAFLPLIVSDKAIGAFVLYTNQPEFFDADGLALLTELAGNVAFAIDHSRNGSGSIISPTTMRSRGSRIAACFFGMPVPSAIFEEKYLSQSAVE